MYFWQRNPRRIPSLHCPPIHVYTSSPHTNSLLQQQNVQQFSACIVSVFVPLRTQWNLPLCIWHGLYRAFIQVTHLEESWKICKTKLNKQKKSFFQRQGLSLWKNLHKKRGQLSHGKPLSPFGKDLMFRAFKDTNFLFHPLLFLLRFFLLYFTICILIAKKSKAELVWKLI